MVSGNKSNAVVLTTFVLTSGARLPRRDRMTNRLEKRPSLLRGQRCRLPMSRPSDRWKLFRDKPTHSLSEISKKCVPIWEGICRLRRRVIHEREMTGTFDNVHLYWHLSPYYVIQELCLSGGVISSFVPVQARIGKRTPSSAPGTLKKSVAGAKSTNLSNRLSGETETHCPARVHA